LKGGEIMKRQVAIILCVILIFGQGLSVYASVMDNYPDLPPGTPDYVTVSGKQYNFNPYYWTNPKYHVVVYGSPSDIKPNDYDSSIKEYRYLGYDINGQKLTNQLFPPDALSGKPLSEKNWIYEPWYSAQINDSGIYSIDPIYGEDINRMKEYLGWSPLNNTTDFFKYVYVQSYPTLTKNGSGRMWHRTSDGKVWYQTFDIPMKPKKEVYPTLDTPIQATTQITSSDFTIAQNENTVTLKVNVKGQILDDFFYDQDNKVLYYNRDDIKEWQFTLSYKGKTQTATIKTNGTSIANNTFSIILSRNDVENGEKIDFIGEAKTIYLNDKFNKDADIDSCNIIVESLPPIPKLPPSAMLQTPSEVNVNESYQVKNASIIPSGETVTSVILEKSTNGTTYTSVLWDNNSITESYSTEQTLYYKLTVTLSNGTTSTATATTNVVDNRSATASANLNIPRMTYEGHWITGSNRNRFYFEGNSYNSDDANSLGLGFSSFDILDESGYYLENFEYDTANWDSDISVDISFKNPNKYQVSLEAIPKNGTSDIDIKTITVLPTPWISANLSGTQKDDRKQMLNVTTQVNPLYPIDYSKTYIDIEDTVTGEKVRVTTSNSLDSANIKTRDLIVTKGTYQDKMNLEFLVKTSTTKDFNFIIYQEDIRGNNKIFELTKTIEPDLFPTANIVAKSQELRDPELSNKAEITLRAEGYSTDGDMVTATWYVRFDNNKNGSLTDETWVNVTTLDGFTNISGNMTEIKFLKSGVGKVEAKLVEKEIFGQDTLSEFVTMTDRLETSNTKIIDVINVAPYVDFKVRKFPYADFKILSSTNNSQNVANNITYLKQQLVQNQTNPTVETFTFNNEGATTYTPIYQTPAFTYKSIKEDYNILTSHVSIDDKTVYNIKCSNETSHTSYCSYTHTIEAIDYATKTKNWIYTLSYSNVDNVRLLVDDKYLYISESSTRTLIVDKNTGTLIKTIDGKFFVTGMELSTEVMAMTDRYTFFGSPKESLEHKINKYVFDRIYITN